MNRDNELVHLHIGLDKAGSTAIQSHMWLNRQWYAERGILIPDTGFIATGHQILFKQMFPDNLGPLHAELDAVRKLGFKQLFISWEGLHSFSVGELQLLKQLFPGSTFIIYVYLREQSEIIQSGYLQQLKSGTTRLTLEEARHSESFLFQELRNYKRMLDRFSSLFGKDSIRARVYDRTLLLEGDVIRDMLATMGLKADEDFTFQKSASNISLDVPAASLVNELEATNVYSEEERRGLVDVLLNDIAVNGCYDRYFLSKVDSIRIQRHYLKSNRAVVKSYFGPKWPYPNLFPYMKKTHAETSEADIQAAVAAKKRQLDALRDVITWDGKILRHNELNHLAGSGRGWLQADEQGLRPAGISAELNFRPMFKRLHQIHTGLRLMIDAVYDEQLGAPDITLNGKAAGVLVWGQTYLQIPFSALDHFNCISLRFTIGKEIGQHLLQEMTFKVHAIAYSVIRDAVASTPVGADTNSKPSVFQ